MKNINITGIQCCFLASNMTETFTALSLFILYVLNRDWQNFFLCCLKSLTLKELVIGNKRKVFGSICYVSIITFFTHSLYNKEHPSCFKMGTTTLRPHCCIQVSSQGPTVSKHVVERSGRENAEEEKQGSALRAQRPLSLQEIGPTLKTLSTLNPVSQGHTPTHAHTNVGTQTHTCSWIMHAHTMGAYYTESQQLRDHPILYGRNLFWWV